MIMQVTPIAAPAREPRVSPSRRLGAAPDEPALQPNRVVTEIVYFHYASIYPGRDDSAHMHPYHQLDVIFNGEVTYTLEGAGAITLRGPSALVIPPLTEHQINTRRITTHAVLKMFLTDEYAAMLGGRPVVFQPQRAVSDMLHDAGRQFAEGAAFSVTMLGAVGTMALIGALGSSRVGRLGPPGGELQGFRRALIPLLYRVSSAPGEVTVADLAHACHVSPDHFSRLFDRLLGTTPQTYLMRRRMQGAAADLLQHPRLTMKAIAERAGYRSVSTFGRAFRQYFSMTPNAYRQQKT